MLALAPKRRRFRLRTRTLLALFALVVVSGAIGAWFYVGVRTARRLREAQALADRLDPGWRLGNLLARRDAIPEAENAALQVRRVLALMPVGWPPVPRVAVASNPRGFQPGEDLLTRIDKVPPNERLDNFLALELRDELAKYPQAIAEARKLAGMPRGRYPVTIATNVIMTMLPDAQASRGVARLLKADAILRAHDGDLDGALESCRALLNCGRAIGDEPFAISQLIRVAIGHMATLAAERVLAQGEPSDAALAKFQDALVEESRHSVLLTSIRGERAMMDDLFSKFATGEVDVASLGGPGGVGPASYLPAAPAFFRYNHALCLEHLNKAVEIAKRPDAEQIDLWAAWEREFQPPDQVLSRLAGTLTYMLTPAVSALGQAHLRYQAQLASAVAILASERHRRANGGLPKSLDAVETRFAPGLGGDPYDGRPLRFRATTDGVLIYAVGPDREDDGGKLDPRHRPTRGTDEGLKLFSADRRRLPPKHELPENVFQGSDQRPEDEEP